MWHQSPIAPVAVLFDTDNPEFVRGFEAGRLAGRLERRPDEPIEQYVHATNAEMVIRLGEAAGRRVWSRDAGEGWLIVRFEVAGGELPDGSGGCRLSAGP
jgi:hypothetical protein